jgi:prepilin-type N-terminal cleavage/methylation domain-containing protein
VLRSKSCHVRRLPRDDSDRRVELEGNVMDGLRKMRDEGGFTLIELLIVIIVLSILAAIVVFAVGTTGANATAAACSADAKSFEAALESYKAEVGMYPGAGSGVAGPTGTATPNYYGLTGNSGAQWQVNQVAANPEIGPFLRELPSTSRYQIVTDGNGGVFVYPSGASIPSPSLMDSQYFWVDDEVPGAQIMGPSGLKQPDQNVMNFDTNPSICADPNVVSG